MPAHRQHIASTCKKVALFDDSDWMVAPGGDHPHNIGPKFIALNIELVLFTRGNSRTLERSLFTHVSGRGTSAIGDPEP